MGILLLDHDHDRPYLRLGVSITPPPRLLPYSSGFKLPPSEVSRGAAYGELCSEPVRLGA
jgi:hypothetical protein